MGLETLKACPNASEGSSQRDLARVSRKCCLQDTLDVHCLDPKHRIDVSVSLIPEALDIPQPKDLAE